MDELLKKGITLYEKKQYEEAFSKFVECNEYYFAGICQLNLNKLNEPINMFILAINNYQKTGEVEINTPEGKSPILIIYLKLAILLLKTNEPKIALGAMAYGLKESKNLLKNDIDKKEYEAVKTTLNYYIEKANVVDNKDNQGYQIVLDEFSSFLNRKLKFLSKKEKKSAFINLELECDENINPIRPIIMDSYGLSSKEMFDVIHKTRTKNNDKKELNSELELLTTIIILEIKESKYLRIVKYLYKDNELRFFLNKNTNKLECEQILEYINIEDKTDEDISNLKNILNNKYKITKEILIRNE